VKIMNYVGVYILSLGGGWLIAGLAVYLMRKSIRIPREFFKVIDLWVGGTERAVATTLVLFAPHYLPGFIGGWVVLKFAANWQRQPNEPGVAQKSLAALVGSIFSFAVAIGAGLYCGPVLRHPAELIQAANDRSVVTV